MPIVIDKLAHTYLQGTLCEKRALRDVSLELPEGGRIGIAGRSGAGKTTLILHLNGLLLPTAGKLWVNGVEVCERNLMELRRKVGIVFQQPERQFFKETVHAEISFALAGSSLSVAEQDLRVKKTLRDVGLGEELLHRSPFSLSTGEKRRVAIASVMVSRPEVLVLDEPGAGLDPCGRREILDFIKRLQQELGFTLIFLSHNMDDIGRLCDRVVVLKEGTVALNGETRKVFSDAAGLDRAGIAPPQITLFMRKLKKAMPEVDDAVLTVEEAAAQLARLWKDRERREALQYEGYDHGGIHPRPFDHPQIGPEDQDSTYNGLHGACLFA